MHKDVNVNVSGPMQPTSTYKTKVLKGNHSFASQVTEPNMKYVIKHNFDLGGESVTIPENCVLEFDGGSLRNGEIGGNYINIRAGNYQIFHNIEFNAITFNNGLNVCWIGCKGDWVPGSTTYTDNTEPFKVAFNSGLSLYIPDGKYGFDNPVEVARWNSVDTENGRMNISIIGQSKKSTWLVALFDDETKDFIKITNGFGGIIENIFITTSDNNHCRYGLYLVGLLNGGIIRDIAIFGNFNWCFRHEGDIQYSSLEINVSRGPENNTVKNPLNGVYISTIGYSSEYIYGFDINLFLETYMGGEGLHIETAKGMALRIKALCEGNISRAGYFNLGTCKTLMYDSYCETVYQNGEGFVFENSTRVFLRNLFGSAVKAINSYIDSRASSVYATEGSLVTIDRDYPIKGSGLSAMPNNFSVKLRGAFPSDLHTNYNVGATLENDASNLASNKYDTTVVNLNAILCGIGCEDKAHYHGFNHSVKIWGENTDSHPSTTKYIAKNIISQQDVIKLKDQRLIAVSVLIKPIDTYYEMTTLQINLGTNLSPSGLNFEVSLARGNWIELSDGWYQVIALIRINSTRVDYTKSMTAEFRGLSIEGYNVHTASYYLSQILISDANGGVPRHFVIKNSESINCNIEKGTTAERPTFLESDDMGLKYFDEDLGNELLVGSKMRVTDLTLATVNKKTGATPTEVYIENPFEDKAYNINLTRHSSSYFNLYLSKTNPYWSSSDLKALITNQTTREDYLVNIEDSEEYPYLLFSNADSNTDVVVKITEEEEFCWKEQDGAIAGVKRSGTFAEKPAADDIYVGFKYFCTDKQTIEGATNGIEITHKGNDVWVDALGRVVS